MDDMPGDVLLTVINDIIDPVIELWPNAIHKMDDREEEELVGTFVSFLMDITENEVKELVERDQ